MSSLLTCFVATLIKRRMTATMSSRVSAFFSMLRNLQAGGGILAFELSAELVAADAREVVALLIEEQRLEQLLGVLRVLGLAGAQLLVDFLERVFLGLDVLVFFKAVRDQRRVVEQRQNRLIAFPMEAQVRTGERAHERCRIDLAILVDANADRALGLVVLRSVVGLELDPGAAIGDDRRVVRRAIVRIAVLQQIDARRTHELAHDHALRAVDHERALVGHEREVAHEDLLVGDALDFARLRGDEANADAQRRAVGHVAFAAFLNGILGFAQRMLAEFQNEVTGEILDRRDRLERFLQAVVDEPLERRFLKFDQIRDRQRAGDFRKRVPRALRTRIVVRFDGERFRRYFEHCRSDVVLLDRRAVAA